MSRSQNGYTLITRNQCKVYQVSDQLKMPLRNNDAGWILADLIRRIDKHVVNIDKQKDDWGWAPPRLVRGSTSVYSNHCSGTAVDIDAIKHPLGKTGTWTSAQKNKIHELMRLYEGAVRWGEDYHNRKDGMHFEIVVNATECTRIARKIRTARKAARAAA